MLEATMSIDCHYPDVLKEWHRIDERLRLQLKKKLQERLSVRMYLRQGYRVK